MKRREHSRLHGAILHDCCQIEYLVILHHNGLTTYMETFFDMEHIVGLTAIEIYELIEAQGLIIDKEHKGH